MISQLKGRKIKQRRLAEITEKKKFFKRAKRID